MRDARGLHEPLPAAHRVALAHPPLGARGLDRGGQAPGPARRRAAHLARRPRAAGRRARVPVRLRARRRGGLARGGRAPRRGGGRGAPPRADLRLRALPDRAPAPVLAPRPAPQPAARGAGRAARGAHRGHRQRARARARAHLAPGRDGGGAAGKDAGRDRAQPARQLLARARPARADGGALSRAPGLGGGERAARRAPPLRPHRGPRLPLPGLGGPAGGREARRPLRRALRGALRQELGRRRPPRRGAARDPPPRPVRLLPTPPRPARARPRCGGRGARAGIGAPPPAPGTRARLERVVDRLLPHRALARGPDRQRAAARPLPERGADGSAGHRPGLPARHPRRADPTRARPLRARPLRARGRLLDLPGAFRGPRLREGARAAARGDRAAGAPGGPVEEPK